MSLLSVTCRVVDSEQRRQRHTTQLTSYHYVHSTHSQCHLSPFNTKTQPACSRIIDATIPSSQLPSPDFLDDLSLTGRITVLKLCLLRWKATEAFESCIVPREFQLRAALATVMKKNSIVDVGTGYGKTLAMILPHLLLPDKVSVVLSPYKHLQEQQQGDFTSYGICAIVINEDTPQDDGLWKVCGQRFHCKYNIFTPPYRTSNPSNIG
jgi:hypothetical protein